MKLISWFLFLFFPLALSAQVEGVKVFDNGGDVPYRIPAICSLPDGTLLAAADYRFTKADIGGGRLDLHLRLSSDLGRTWGDVLMPSQMRGDGDRTPSHQECGFGDPCLVADRKSGKVMLTSCSGTPGFFSGSRTHHQGWAQWYSEDGGKTWSSPRYLDEEFVYSRFDNSAYGPIKGWFIGSGKIHQSRYVKVKKYYRLYCAGSSYNGQQTANWVMYSDDFGASWQFLGGCDASPVPGGDEPKVEELPDGNLVISSRHVSGRTFNIFTFSNAKKAAGTWGNPVLSDQQNHGVWSGGRNGCNGEIQILPVRRLSDGARTWLALQSLPVAGRTNVTIFYKVLDSPSRYASSEAFARDWTAGLQVSHTTSAYSTWSLCRNHTIGMLYEENEWDGGYDIVYKNLSLEQITNQQFTFDKRSRR